VTVARGELPTIANSDAAGEHVSVMGGVAWHNTATDEVIYAATPEGVPDNYVYVPPDEEAGDEYDVVTSPQGATYRSPQPSDEYDEQADLSVGQLVDGNPRASIDTPDAAQQYLEEFDPNNSEYEHWSGANYEKVDDGSIVKVWAGDMGFDEETALVTDVDGDTYTVVTRDGVEKTMSPAMDTMSFDPDTEAPLADVWNDSANRAADIETQTPSDDDSDGVEPDTWFDDSDLASTYPVPDEGLSPGATVDMNGQLAEVESTSTDGDITVSELSNGKTVSEVDGVLTQVSDTSRVDLGSEQYIEWNDDADYADGWYAIDDSVTETDGGLSVEATTAGGDTVSIDGVAVERDGLIDRKHEPTNLDVAEPDLTDAHESYDGSYPDNVDLEQNVSLEAVEDDLTDAQRDAVTRGLGKAQQLGLTDSVNEVLPMEVEGETPGMTLGRFEPESGTIRINTDQLRQETIDSLDDDFAVGDSVEDMLVHESIHAKHAEELRDGGMSTLQMREQYLRDELPEDERQIMEAAVSEYGASNPLEVVAEIGTQITLGREVPDEALYLYEKYGGPEL